MPRRFLLITYYWPPSGGAGVMRWVKMSRYVRQFGWEPIIYTPSNPEYGMHDESLLKEIDSSTKILRTPIWEPYSLYKRFIGRSKKDKVYSGFIHKKKKASLAQRISIFIRGHFFIPDARMFWIRPSVKFLKKYLKENPVDAIVTTGPPHSMHIIGLKVHQATGIPWIPDFRDPWTNIDFYQDLHLTRWADRKHHRLEHEVLTKATRVVTASWRSRDEFKEISGRDDIVVIPNGYDDADFDSVTRITLDEKFTVVHLGSMNKDRNPDGWWKAVRYAVDSNPELKQNLCIKLVGPVDFIVRESVNKFGLNDVVEFIEYIPHTEAVQMMRQAQVLLLIINHAPNARTMIPGKLYEYLGSHRPLFTIGYNDSDSAKVIHMTNGGPVWEYDDVKGMKQQLLSYYHEYETGHLVSEVSGIERFTRKNLAGKYAEILEEVASTTQD